MRIVISSDPRLLHVLRGVVRYRAQEAGFGPADVEYLTLAIDEAVANVMRHAYGNRRDAKVALEILAFPDRLEFVVEDTGPKVEPEALRPRALDDVRPGGLGTYFINCCMDAISYEENFAGGNRLRMVKHLPPKVSTSDEYSSQERG